MWWWNTVIIIIIYLLLQYYDYVLMRWVDNNVTRSIVVDDSRGVKQQGSQGHPWRQDQDGGSEAESTQGRATCFKCCGQSSTSLAMPFYGTQAFDPKLIAGQIVVLQTLFYMFEGLFVCIFYILFGSQLTLDSIFYFRNLTITNTMGWGNIFIMLACTAGMAYVLVYVVERAKKCLDFSFTLFFIHFCFCWIYGGFPDTVEWWVINILCCILMTVLGERLCMNEEQKDISL